MPKTRAVTHADLASNPGSLYLGGKTVAFLMILATVCCLFSFVLCLVAEATRSQMAWLKSNDEENEGNSKCIYNGSGKTPLLCAAGALIGLAAAMVLEHIYVLVIVGKTPPPIVWDPDSAFTNTITWQAGLFFVTSWICFAVGEILLLIGVAMESGHLKEWSRPRPNCLIVREGLFSAAGVFALLTVFFSIGLYLAALRALRDSKLHELEILEATAASYVFQPRSIQHGDGVIARDNQIKQPSSTHPPACNQPLNLV
ncbi:hypothetical protein SADUNF_Sadunf08G0087800 [Salix dunnii]|uniref:Transmembrane protein n=1 Tax=Salix dunnii TaxID=1413687 RepID=A0A835JXJ5_9ROSI|nr:hypothetical protein SADUNF_Sadunf08G0087800 [Salix dunnii]